MSSARRSSLLVIVCLGLLYTVWGSTYLAQRIAVESFTPLQMAGLRFLTAGGALYAALRLRGAPRPTLAEWRAVTMSAVPFLVTGMGAAAYGIKRVPSGLAALVFGSVPLWSSLFDRLWGGRLSRLEGVGLAVGFAGVAVVSVRGGLSADPIGAAVLLWAAASYAFGATATRKLALPKGILATGAQMLVGGALLMVVSFAMGDRLTMPPARPLLAFGYLVVFGSLVAYVAFGYLLRNVRPALATSYAFVNPIVALALGAALAGERFGVADLVGLGLVLAAVALVAAGGRRAAREAAAGADPSKGAAPARVEEAASAPPVLPIRLAAVRSSE